MPVIPANPGFEVISFNPPRDQDPEKCDVLSSSIRHSVIAWQIDKDDVFDPKPITVHGIEAGRTEHGVGIIDPNGSVTSQGYTTHPNLQEWAKFARGGWILEHARRQETGWSDE